MSFRTISDQQEFGRDFFAHLVEDLDDVANPFHLSEVGDMDENLLALTGYCFPEVVLVQLPEAVEVEKVRNDFNAATDTEVLLGIAT